MEVHPGSPQVESIEMEEVVIQPEDDQTDECDSIIIIDWFNVLADVQAVLLFTKISINLGRKSTHWVALSIISTAWRFLSFSRDILFII